MRLIRNRAKRAVKDRCRRHQAIRSTDGIRCPYCEPHRNSVMNKMTAEGRRAYNEIKEALGA